MFSFAEITKMPSEKGFSKYFVLSWDKANVFHLSIQQCFGEEFHENYLKLFSNYDLT